MCLVCFEIQVIAKDSAFRHFVANQCNVIEKMIDRKAGVDARNKDSKIKAVYQEQ